ncbi:50S ribosomal protein L33 [Mycoplasma sp. SG1]|nr:50S ribosomal protein L33 [Mycoplasma sp. SG1]URM53117.1 50S ribosomal protein L33 [Mycoplasma sp. SG1]
MRKEFTLKCTVCGFEGYISSKNKITTPDKIQILKFCKKCNKRTLHKEKK